jgi:hypothetical protein
MAPGRPVTTPGYCFRCRSHDRKCVVIECRDSGWLLCHRCYVMKNLAILMELQAMDWEIEPCPMCDMRVCRCKEMV